MFMSQERGLVTDQLMNIIQVLQLGRKSGLLTVERGEGMALEKGEITFIQGQITRAQRDQFSGQQALNWLSVWGPCRFTFTPTTLANGSDPITGPLNLILPQAPKETNPHLRTLPITQGIPSPHSSQPQESFQIGNSIPQRIHSDDEALRLLDQAGLSRSLRHLFLLIDGRRTTIELARLMRKKHEDVHKLLLELEHIGIIHR